MRQSSQRNFVNGLLFIALFLLASTGIYTYQCIQKLQDANDWVMHTYQVILKIDNAKLALVNAERSLRISLVTDDKADIEEWAAFGNNIQSDLQEIRRLTSDNIHQQQRLDQLTPLLQAKATSLQEIAKLNDKQAALISMSNQKEQELTKAINQLFGEMIQNEESLLSQRNAASAYDAKQSNVLIIAAGILIVVLLLLGFMVLNYQVGRSERAERKSRELEDRFKKIIESSHDLIASFDLNFKFLAFNHAYKNMFRKIFASEIQEGISLAEALKNYVDKDTVLKNWQAGLRSEEHILVSDLRNSEKDDTSYEIIFNSIRDEDNKPIGASMVMRDITERRKVEKLKDEFLSMVSHELRTPLASIKGSLRLLVGGAVGDLNEKSLQMLNIAYNNCDRLNFLINDLLDFEKLTSGKFELNVTAFDLNKLVEETVDQIQKQNEKSAVKIILTKSTHPANALGDRERILKVLSNLISNAIKFSPPGKEVLVSVSADKGLARVTVTDHGEGIPEEWQKNIFDKFVQGDSSATRKQGGLGLGLSISKDIIEKHNGHIGFKSKVNQGSVFYFDLPLANN